MYKTKNCFPLLEKYTYINTAAHGFMSSSLLDYRVQLSNKMAHHASVFTDTRGEFMMQVRTTVAQFIGAAVEHTALIPSFSYGYNALLEGIDKDKHFLLIDGDYPSVNQPVQARGFKTTYAALNENLENNILEAVEQHQPDFLALSLVQYISGIAIDFEFIKKLKEQYPQLVIIADGTQYVGCGELRFRESGIDILAASCYKWLNAGGGNAFMVFNKHAISKVQPKFTGYGSHQGFKNERGSFIGHFEPGHQDFIAFGSLKHAIEEAQELGLITIENQIKELSKYALKQFSKRNLLAPAVASRSQHSSIFNIKGSDQLFEKLTSHHIICSQRGDGIRVSFSYYNTIADVDQLLEVIDGF